MRSNSPSLSRPRSTTSEYSNNSSPSATNGTRRRKKKQLTVPPVNLEEVFNHVSEITSANINPPPTRIVLTPRSAEICLKLGINPEVLKIRDIDSFWEPGIDPAVQRIRHEAYVQRRYDLMKQCRVERKRIAVAEFESATNLNVQNTMTPEMILKQQEEQTSTLIQLEMQRIEKMKKRQQKELESMIQYEMNRAKVAQEMDKRIQESKKKDEMRKKQLEKRMRLVAEERRLKEMQKTALEEAEEQRRVAIAKEAHEREAQIAEEQQRKMNEQRRKAREEEVMRKKQHEEHRRQVEQFFTEEQMRLRQRLESMQYAEKKKQDAIMRKQQDHAEQMRKKRVMIEQRIDQNMQMAKLIEDKKKQDFISKQEHFERVREDHLRRQEEERLLKAQELELQEQRRRMILYQQKKEEEMKADQLLEKFELEEEHLQDVQVKRNKDLTIQKEKKVLRTQMKLENVQRVMRATDYKRQLTVKKIETNEERIERLVQQRQALIEERRKAAILSKQQKESISKVMEEVRTNATKAGKIISKVLTGKMSMEDLANQSQTLNGSQRSKSASKSKKKGFGKTGDSDKSRSISADSMGLSNMRSQSAGEYMYNTNDNNEYFNESDKNRLPPMANGVVAASFSDEKKASEALHYSTMTNGGAKNVAPQQFVSPYAMTS